MSGPTNKEFEEAFASEKVQRLIRDVGLEQAELLKRLRPRRDEMELEIAPAREELAKARSRVFDITGRALTFAREGRGTYRVYLSLAYLGVLLTTFLAARFTTWTWAESLAGFWKAPFASAWPTTGIWAGGGAAVAVLLVEIDRRVRRERIFQIAFETNEGLSSARSQMRDAESAYQARIVEAVSAHITEELNSQRHPLYSNEIRVRLSGQSDQVDEGATIGVGLSESANDDHEIPTEQGKRLLQMIQTLPGGSIGISGPRGVGKSTLLSSLCRADIAVDNGFAITVPTAAPVEYQPRDFLLHLFSSLCRRVVEAEGGNLEESERRAEVAEIQQWHDLSRREHLRRLPRLLNIVGLCALWVAVLIGALNWGASTATPVSASAQSAAKPAAASKKDEGSFRVQWAEAWKAVGLSPSPFAMFGVGAFTLAFSMTVFQASLPKDRRDLRLVPELYGRDDRRSRLLYSKGLGDRSIRELRNIRFQRSFTTGWSGAIKAPASFELSANAGLSLQQQPESLPELVERFRKYVKDVIAVHGAVVFGIDELDKFKSANEAEAFLNGIKSVFGIEKCFFLISVSEDALSAFDRRGLGVRDAFDSSLDEVLHLDFLNLTNARTLLNRRVLRLPDPFLQLCHMLGGGLPRDLIRHARQLLEIVLEEPDRCMPLTHAAHLLIATDLIAKKRATQVAIRALKMQPDTNKVLREITKLSHNIDPAHMTLFLADYDRELENLPKETEDERRLARLAEELSIYYRIMMLTVRIVAVMGTERGWEHAARYEIADRLAEARQALEAGVPMAEAEIAMLAPTVEHLEAEVMLSPEGP